MDQVPHMARPAGWRDMLRRMRDLPSWDGGDGGFLNSYFVDRCTCPGRPRHLLGRHPSQVAEMKPKGPVFGWALVTPPQNEVRTLLDHRFGPSGV